MARLIVEAGTSEIIGMSSDAHLQILVAVSDEDGYGVSGLTKDNFRMSQLNVESLNPEFSSLTIDVTERNWGNNAPSSGFYDLNIHTPTVQNALGSNGLPFGNNVMLSFGLEVFDAGKSTTNPLVGRVVILRHGRTVISLINL